jgi:prolipoprotein diacylglyceryltransferase
MLIRLFVSIFFIGIATIVAAKCMDPYDPYSSRSKPRPEHVMQMYKAGIAASGGSILLAILTVIWSI